MARKLNTLVILVLLALCLGFAVPVGAGGSQPPWSQAGNLTPTNTVVVANTRDARFSRDFSALLKHLRLEWVVLDSPVVPESIRDKNLVVLGHPDAQHSGEVIRGLLTAEEVEQLRAATDHPVVLYRARPWMDGGTVVIGSGADMLLVRNAAEEAMRAIIASAPPASDWVRAKYEAEVDDNLRDSVQQLQFQWEDSELPLQDLTKPIGAKPARRITAQQAAEDVERLFYLFSHGYAGYAFFNRQGEFDQARTAILQELSSKSSWSTDDFSSLLRERLGFIVDSHLRIGDHKYADHSDFWYDTQLELVLAEEGYRFVEDGTTYAVESIDGADPASFIVPSLNQQGEPIYRLGLLSTEEPAPLLLAARSEQGPRQFKIELQRSDFDYYSEDVFREDVLGGVPVVRARAFGDYFADDLEQFVETAAKHRGDPVVIVDIRGNGGGNERWPVRWIQELTGRRAEAVFVSSELWSKTSMAGRANGFNYWYHDLDVASYRDQVELYAGITEAFESGERQPGWMGPVYPQASLIPNDTTVVVVTNGLVASAGEGMVLRISRVENVLVVGENTMGALTFGNISAHQLPHSRIRIWMPINFSLFLDQELREEVGLAPDLWVPAADAVNFAVAALRRGTITTSRPLAPAALEQDFVPENPNARDMQETVRSLLVIAAFGAGGLAWAFFRRKNPRELAAMGGVWILLGGAATALEGQPVGMGFLLVGIVCLSWGGITLLRARQAPLDNAA